MTTAKTELYILYQMGNSEEWTWFSPAGVFLSEKALRTYAAEKEMDPELVVLEPDDSNTVRLPEPQEYVIVKSQEGQVPDVELETA
ncbi:MAG: hypothetical protein ACLQEQ_08320 [Nitrososphaerales archaeon]